MTDNIFCIHTPAEFCKGVICIGHRATIAARKEPDGTISYGYSICTPEDNFSRKTGAEKAIKTLQETPFKTKAFNHFATPQEALSHFAKGLSNKIYKDFSKYKQKLALHRKSLRDDKATS